MICFYIGLLICYMKSYIIALFIMQFNGCNGGNMFVYYCSSKLLINYLVFKLYIMSVILFELMYELCSIHITLYCGKNLSVAVFSSS